MRSLLNLDFNILVGLILIVIDVACFNRIFSSILSFLQSITY